MEEQGKIIEVEVESSSVDDVNTDKRAEKIHGDHRASIYFFGRLSRILMSICTPLFFVFLGLGLAFSILFSENPQSTPRFALMLTFWSLLGLTVFGVILAFVFRRIMRTLKRRDPNFEESVALDDVYE